jgi:predicted metal-binding membrane protein
MKAILHSPGCATTTAIKIRNNFQAPMPDILQAEPVLELETAARRWRIDLMCDRLFLGTAALLFLLSAGLTIYSCRSMSGGMPMPGGWTMSMAWMRMPGQTWAAAASAFIWLWLVMMVAMMLPSLVLMLLRYRLAVRGQAEAHLGGLTAISAAGYFFVWLIVGAVIYPVGVCLSTAQMQWPTLQRFMPLAIGVVLLLAGAIQLSPWKIRRLTRCRNTLICGQACPSVLTAWRHGLHLGIDCSLCCSGFMILLIVADPMSLPYMAALTAAITAERFAPKPRRTAGMIGVVLVVVGAFAIARAVK